MSSGISNDSAARNSWMLQDFGATGTKGTQATDAGQKAAGAGQTAQAGPTPDAPPPAAMNALMASMTDMMPKMSGQMLDVLLLEVTSKMKDTIDKSEKDKIQTDVGAKRAQIGEKQAKMEEATRKIQEAEDKMKSTSIWDKIKLAFQYVGAILSIIAGIASIIAGAATAATGAGLLAIAGGAMLVTSGLMMLYMAADATYAAVNPDGLGFVGAAVKADKMAGGMPEEEAMKEAGKADMIAKITIGAVAAVLAVAGSIMTLPVAGVALPGVAASITSTASKVPGIIIGLVSGANQLATSAGDITVGVLKNEANQEKADGMKKKAEAKSMEASIQALDDMIDMAMQRLKGASERFDAMLDALTDRIQSHGESMANAAVGLRA